MAIVSEHPHLHRTRESPRGESSRRVRKLPRKQRKKQQRRQGRKLRRRRRRRQAKNRRYRPRTTRNRWRRRSPTKTKPERGEARTKSQRTPEPTAERNKSGGSEINHAIYRHLRAGTVAVLVGDDGATARCAWGHKAGSKGLRSARVFTAIPSGLFGYLAAGTLHRAHRKRCRMSGGCPCTTKKPTHQVGQPPASSDPGPTRAWTEATGHYHMPRKTRVQKPTECCISQGSDGCGHLDMHHGT